MKTIMGSRFSWGLVAIIAIFGLQHLVRGAVPFIPPTSTPSLRSYFELVAGMLTVALAVALWRDRGVRPLVAVCLPVALIASVLPYYEAMRAARLDPWSGRGLLLW